mmetsp:Transcript_31321/g.93015  ORF Transcript_31321/g.93015 Transcript_31321/m.93015 type:complete len:249 (+) Transcript_31321:192-938(+)
MDFRPPPASWSPSLAECSLKRSESSPSPLTVPWAGVKVVVRPVMDRRDLAVETVLPKVPPTFARRLLGDAAANSASSLTGASLLPGCCREVCRETTAGKATSKSVSAASRLRSIEDWTRLASCTHSSRRTFPVENTVYRKHGMERPMTKDSHEVTNSVMTPLKKSEMKTTNAATPRLQMRMLIVREVPQIQTNISKDLRFSCVTECAIASCMSQLVAEGCTRWMHEITTFAGNGSGGALQSTARCCLL